MSSSRLPGKVLRPINGRPALGMLLDRLALARQVDLVAIATSDRAADEEVVAFCAQRGTHCHRGPLDDLARRMLGAAESFDLDGFIRVNGDSPLLDPALVDRAAVQLRSGDCDVVSNVFPRSFPVGQSVEAIRTDAMRRAVREMTTAEEREHVTAWFYAHPDRVRIESFRSEHGDWSGMSLALDTREDARAVEAVLAMLDRPHTEYGWRELADLRAIVGDGSTAG